MVVLGHCARGSFHLVEKDTFFAASWGDRLLWPAWPANQMVYLFLMVSGFSLFYAEDVRRLTGRPATTLRQFVGRRGWRILPTYYLAFAWGLLVLALVPNRYIDGLPAMGPEPVTAGGVLSHLVLLHNTRQDWVFQGSGPLWSMAFEVQLYLLFPLLFWAVRRFGAWIPCGAAVALDVAVHWGRAEDLFPIGLLRWFALGILAAAIYRAAWLKRVPTWVLLGGGGAALLLGYARFPLTEGGLKRDVVWGAAFLALLLAMTRAPASSRNPMNWRPTRWVGIRSYSLYAFHFPLLWVVAVLLAELGFARDSFGWAAGLVLLGVPASLALAAVTYRWIEEPSLRRVKAVR